MQQLFESEDIKYNGMDEERLTNKEHHFYSRAMFLDSLLDVLNDISCRVSGGGMKGYTETREQSQRVPLYC